MNLIRNEPETLHIGEDWRRVYNVTADFDISTSRAICKVRSIQGKLLVEADCTVDGNSVYVIIDANKTMGIGKVIKTAKYDVFLIGDNYTAKLIMGDIVIVNDVSMH